MFRPLEVVLCLIGALVLAPLMFLIAIAVKVQDGGPVLFRARRVGRHGKEFLLYKFRTMVPDAHRRGAAITVAGDARVTPLGKFLRHWKLDELPQLFNVIKGEMSLVGARPEDPCYVALYDDEQRRILEFRPGITSPASLYYRHEEQLLNSTNWQHQYQHAILPRKLAMDLSYLRRRTLFSDVVIIFRTLGGIIR